MISAIRRSIPALAAAALAATAAAQSYQPAMPRSGAGLTGAERDNFRINMGVSSEWDVRGASRLLGVDNITLLLGGDEEIIVPTDTVLSLEGTSLGLWQSELGITRPGILSLITGGTFGAGNAAALTNLNASNLASGTVAPSRLPNFTLNLSGALHSTPVTFVSGTGTATLSTQAANAFFAGPASGTTAAQPAFRAMVDADIPATYRALAGGYVMSDGVTALRGLFQVPGTRGALGGSLAATWRGVVSVPTTSGTFGIAELAASGTTTAAAQTWSLGLGWVGNDLVLRANGAATTDNRTLTVTGARTTYSGQTLLLEAALTSGTATPTIRVNDATLSGTATTAGTPPDWLSASLVATQHIAGLNYPPAPMPLGSWINWTLTDADRAFWRASGQPPAWVAAGGHATPVVSPSIANGGFETAGSPVFAGWYQATSGGGSLTMETSLVRSGTAAARLTRSGSGFAVLGVSGLVPGASYILDFYARGVGATQTVRVGDSLDSTRHGQFAAPVGTWTRCTVLLTAGSGLAREVEITTGFFNVDFVIDDVTLVRVGALSLPGVQPMRVVDDASAIETNAALIVGGMPVTTRRDWRVTARTSTSGNEQLLGGTIFNEPTRHRISTWTVRNTGTTSGTISLGSASAGTQYLSSGTAAVGNNDLTLSLRYPPTGALWINSSGTNEMIHTITGHRIAN